MRTLVVLLVLLFAAAAPAQMQEAAGELVIPNTEILRLTAEANGHEYLITVALPDSYAASEENHPVLYVLDPSFALLSVIEQVRWLSAWGELPELIIVGIGYQTDDPDRFTELRTRDYHTAQEEFLGVIQAEVFPLIEARYRVDATDRGLIGYSYGGEFVYHVLANDPSVFRRYLAIDANAREVNALLRADDADFRARFAGLDVKLFISMAGFGNPVLTAFERGAYEGLEVSGLTVGNVTHGAALHLSLAPGIRAIYD